MPNPTTAARLAYSMAAYEAESLGAAELGTEHLFIGLCKADALEDTAALQALGLDAAARDAAREEAAAFLRIAGEASLDLLRARRRLRDLWLREHPERTQFSGHRTEACRAVCAAAERRVEGRTTLLALMRALLEKPEPLVERTLAEQKLAAPQLAARFEAALPSVRETGVARWGRDLSRLAREGQLRPVLARDAETKQVARILMQAAKSNPLLVGEPGVGKTAIVEGLAVRLAGPDAPAALRGTRIVEVSPGTLLAGTGQRGEFEERVQELMREAERDPNLVVFIDEAHSLLGSGGAARGAMSAADLLKPALARGTIRCIAATTLDEYRKHIEPDAGLARRFQLVWVDEPTREQALTILQGVKANLESHHGVRIEEAALEAAVDLSIRYLPELKLPDKAIDLLDQACTRALLGTFSASAGAAKATAIGRPEIASVVSERCRVPVEDLRDDEAKRMLGMDDVLRRRVIGQDTAVAQLADALRTAKAGLRDPRRPLGVFLLLGPTGTGKTELARALAEFLFGDERSLIRLDMSEYAEKHQAARLIGAPPGYIGHDEGGQLTDAVRARPYSVVLFDEVEKAHPDVHGLFLQIFDEGALTDGHGRSASFREAVILLTSNLGATRDGATPRVMGFQRDEAEAADSAEEQMLDAVERAFRPELRNRIQKILVFRELSPEAVGGIVDKVLRRANQSLAPRKIVLGRWSARSPGWSKSRWAA
jgi:ATP-dependent Clp protease ATP-binding subunit ClpC